MEFTNCQGKYLKDKLKDFSLEQDFSEYEQEKKFQLSL